MLFGIAQAQNRLRYELRLRDALLDQTVIETLGDLRDDRLHQVSRRYWDLCGFGRHVALPALLDAVRSADAAGERKAFMRAVAWLLAQEVGSPSTASHNTLDRYRAVLRRHGADAAMLRGAFGAGVPYRLDFDSGLPVPI